MELRAAWLSVGAAVLLSVPARAEVLEQAVPTIDLPTPDRDSVPHAVAYHPGFDRYYGADSGSPDRRGWVWDATGTVVQNFPPPLGVDVRGLYYDPTRDAIEAVTFNAVNGDGGIQQGLFGLGLDGGGLYNGINLNRLASLPGLAGSQTLPAYDPDRDLLYSRDSTPEVNVVSRADGTLIDTITLDLAAAGNPSLQDGFLGYDPDEQALVALDPAAQLGLAFGLEGGFLGASQLSGVDTVNTNGNTGYTNGQIFVFDGSQETYHGFRIFVPEPRASAPVALVAIALLSRLRRKRRTGPQRAG